MVFSMARNGIIAPMFLTTEPNKQNISRWIMRNREAMVIEVNQMEHAKKNRTKAIFASGLQTSRRKKNGYNSTLELLLDAAKLLPQESSSGPVDLAFVEADEAVVDQVWVEVGPSINILVVRMEALLNCFVVRSEERSPFMRHFNLPSYLLEVYLMFVPRDLGGTDSGDGNSDKETDNDKDGESDADKLDMEDANLDRLTDEISLVVGDGSAFADTAGDDDAATAEETSAEE